MPLSADAYWSVLFWAIDILYIEFLKFLINPFTGKRNINRTFRCQYINRQAEPSPSCRSQKQPFKTFSKNVEGKEYYLQYASCDYTHSHNWQWPHVQYYNRLIETLVQSYWYVLHGLGYVRVSEWFPYVDVCELPSSQLSWLEGSCSVFGSRSCIPSTLDLSFPWKAPCSHRHSVRRMLGWWRLTWPQHAMDDHHQSKSSMEATM